MTGDGETVLALPPSTSARVVEHPHRIHHPTGLHGGDGVGQPVRHLRGQHAYLTAVDGEEVGGQPVQVGGVRGGQPLSHQGGHGAGEDVPHPPVVMPGGSTSISG